VIFFVYLTILETKPVVELADIYGNLAGNKARQLLLIAVSHVVLYGAKRRMGGN